MNMYGVVAAKVIQKKLLVVTFVNMERLWNKEQDINWAFPT